MEIPEDKIRKIMKIAKEPISMETPIGDDDDSHLGDFIEDTNNTAPIEAAMQASLRDVVKDILDSLTRAKPKVLRMRFGIEMSTDHTLEEVGKQFDVTRERIRQIEAAWPCSDKSCPQRRPRHQNPGRWPDGRVSRPRASGRVRRQPTRVARTLAVVPGGLPGKETAIKLKTAVAWGEIVELDNDCFVMP